MKNWLCLVMFLQIGTIVALGQQPISQANKDQIVAKLVDKVAKLRALAKQAHEGSTLGDADTVFDDDLAKAEQELRKALALPVITPSPTPPPGEDPLHRFITQMRATQLDHNVIINYSQKQLNLELTMAGDWLALPYQTRLRSAQDLALYWNRYQPGGDVAFYDEKGVQVGGDGDAGIWVKK